MTTKNTNAPETVTVRKPRRIYRHKGKALICYGGHRFVSTTDLEDCSFDLDHPVTKVEAPNRDLSLDDTITVSQRKRGAKTKTETWVMFD